MWIVSGGSKSCNCGYFFFFPRQKKVDLTDGREGIVVGWMDGWIRLAIRSLYAKVCMCVCVYDVMIC